MEHIAIVLMERLWMMTASGLMTIISCVLNHLAKEKIS